MTEPASTSANCFDQFEKSLTYSRLVEREAVEPLYLNFNVGLVFVYWLFVLVSLGALKMALHDFAGLHMSEKSC